MKATADTVQSLFQHPQDTISLRIPSCYRFITLTKRGPQIVLYSASSLKFQYFLFSLWQSSRCLSLLPLFFFLYFLQKIFRRSIRFQITPNYFIFCYLLFIMYSTPIPVAQTTYLIEVGWSANNYLRTWKVLVATYFIWIPQFTCLCTVWKKKKTNSLTQGKTQGHILTRDPLKYERALAIALWCSVIGRINVTVHPWQRWMDLSH